mmetsp:Transcript_19504/g.66895  ORF Transcript_19504/g.66895 Transcript_19504/m.66895 type:complete len:212 (-) Transcript_19504:862-1497(-)
MSQAPLSTSPSASSATTTARASASPSSSCQTRPPRTRPRTPRRNPARGAARSRRTWRASTDGSGPTRLQMGRRLRSRARIAGASTTIRRRNSRRRRRRPSRASSTICSSTPRPRSWASARAAAALRSVWTSSSSLARVDHARRTATRRASLAAASTLQSNRCKSGRLARSGYDGATGGRTLPCSSPFGAALRGDDHRRQRLRGTWTDEAFL